MSRRLIALGCILLAFVAIAAQAPRFAAAFRYQLPTWANWKAYSPYPVNYLARLRMLDGWDATAGDGLNCSGFISNAHGVHFRKSYDYYTNRFNDLTLLSDVESIHAVDESQLQPGDVAAFEGDQLKIKGVHVAAYLGSGIWIDADGRRGTVATWQLRTKSNRDTFFAGHVRLYRWKAAAQFAPLAVMSTLGKDNSSHE